MVSRLIRLILTLTGVSPMLVSIAYVLWEKGQLRFAVIAILAALLLAVLSMKIVEAATQKLEAMRISIRKAKSADKEVIGFYIAYVLPLLFKDSALGHVTAWLLAGALLALVIWATRSFQVNPVLASLGYCFYEVELEDGMTYMLVTKRRLSDLKSVNAAGQISEYGLIDLSQRGKN